MALIEDEAFLPFVKAYAEDEQLFFSDFADAFSKLLSKGCPEHCQPDAATTAAADATEPSVDKDFRDLAMHGSVERMQELLQADDVLVNVNSTEALSGRTALHKAAYFGHVHVIEFLLKQEGILVNAQDADGDTALHDAARFGHVGVVEALLRDGAEKALVNKEGKAALDLAQAAEKDAVIAALA
jgi:ankyrin repeat protein